MKTGRAYPPDSVVIYVKHCTLYFYGTTDRTYHEWIVLGGRHNGYRFPTKRKCLLNVMNYDNPPRDRFPNTYFIPCVIRAINVSRGTILIGTNGITLVNQDDNHAPQFGYCHADLAYVGVLYDTRLTCFGAWASSQNPPRYAI